MEHEVSTTDYKCIFLADPCLNISNTACLEKNRYAMRTCICVCEMIDYRNLALDAKQYS